MIKITLVCVGKLKEEYFIAAAKEYLKRLSRYASVEVIEIEPERLPEKPSAAQIEAALLKESEKIRAKIPKNSDVAALCIEGREYSSEQLSETVKSSMQSGRPLCFLVGGSYGLHKTVKDAATYKISVSKMTFPHKLFRVMLLEQIYRAFKIAEGGNYHK